MTETKDLVYGKKTPEGMPGPNTTEKYGYLAAVSARALDADPLQFEKVDEWNDPEIFRKLKNMEYLGNNSFRIFEERHLSDYQKSC